MVMGNIKLEMAELYNINEYDWMNYKILNDLTYHHIIKKEDGGKITVDNGALLTKRAHSYLHQIEKFDPEIYEMINLLLKEINIQGHEPSQKQRKKMDLLLLKFELRNAIRLVETGKKNARKKAIMATNIRKKEQKGLIRRR